MVVKRPYQAIAWGLTIRSSRHRFAASAKSRRIVTLPSPRSGAGLTQALGGARPRSFQREDGLLMLQRTSQFSSATYSVQPESGCTPSVVEGSGEQHCRRTEPVLCSWPRFDRSLVKNSQCPAKASLVSRLTIRSSRLRFVPATPWQKKLATA